MQTAFIISQSIFYSIASLAIITAGIFFSLVMYHLVRMTKELREITHDFHNLTDDAREKIDDIIEHLSELPLLSFLLKRRINHKKNKNNEKK